MRIRAIVFAGIGASLLSSSAWAVGSVDGNSAPNHHGDRLELADQCSSLESQYDTVIDSHENTHGYDRAMTLHATGLKACRSNDGAVGVIKLEQSLKAIGVTPNV